MMLRGPNNSKNKIKGGWSVFNAIRPFPPSPKPETLMADIDAAIAAAEYAHSTSTLSLQISATTSATDDSIKKNHHHHQNHQLHDARLAEEAYRSACAALASARPDEAVRALRVAIASCPPDKASALAKLRSLLAIATSQQQKQKQKQQHNAQS